MVAKNARRAAYALLRQYKLSVPTLDNLVYIVEDMGFEIVDYSNSRLDSDFSDLVQSLAIHELVKTARRVDGVEGEEEPEEHRGGVHVEGPLARNAAEVVSDA